MSLGCHYGEQSGCRWGLIMQRGACFRGARGMIVESSWIRSAVSDCETEVEEKGGEMDRYRWERVDCHWVGVSGAWAL
jgi:hypothetical protein